MGKEIKTYIVVLTFVLAVAIIASILLQMKNNSLLEKGCPCGGQYEIFDIAHDRGIEYRYYKCNKCGKLFDERR